MDIDNLKKKIKHLLNLAANAGTKEEAATAAGAAEKLAEKYRLDIAELELSGDVDIEPIINIDLYSENATATWKGRLVSVLCKFNGCEPLYIDAIGPNGRKRGGKVTLFGRASDIDVVKYLFAYLSLEVERLAKENTKKQGLSRGSAKGYSNAYKAGAIQGIHEQLKEAQKEVRQTATSAALTVVDKRKDEARKYMKTIHERTVKGQRSKISNFQGFSDGKQAGKNIHLGKSLDNKTKALPSGK